MLRMSFYYCNYSCPHVKYCRDIPYYCSKRGYKSREASLFNGRNCSINFIIHSRSLLMAFLLLA